MLCDTCSLTFFSETIELQDALDRMAVSEEAVARRQVEEDMRLYGMRPDPPEDSAINEFGEINTPLKPSSKRGASDGETSTERPIKTRKIHEGDGSNDQTLTAMDWNSGASPLEAWLNQSAIPAVAPSKESKKPSPSVVLLMAQEIEEVKNFRSVHLTAAPHPESPRADPFNDKALASLRQGARIYYRNIKDKFPLIPTYLARRLAEANLDRATALRKKKHSNDEAQLSSLGDKSASQIRQSTDSKGGPATQVPADGIRLSASARFRQKRLECHGCIQCSKAEASLRTFHLIAP
ncbi:MAG: hypothetical protein Q9169_003976 [Polycauliona sp. 2 TL-2023]